MITSPSTMTEFQLDTSGCVRLAAKDAPWKGLPKPDIYWIDLTPFAQGYVTAALRELAAAIEEQDDPGGVLPLAFSDLAAATLAAMLKDCEAWLRERDEQYGADRKDWRTAEKGADFWGSRNGGAWTNFPPITLSLAPDGLIHAEVKS